MAWSVYEQRTGLFEIYDIVDDGASERCLYQSLGYAGRGDHKNHPESQCRRNQGPLPRGMYRVGVPTEHPRLGPLAFPLYPYERNDMCERSGFFIHGDSRKNPGNASHGCIILNRPCRDAIAEYKVRYLEVRDGLESPWTWLPDPSGEAGDESPWTFLPHPSGEAGD